MHELTRIKQNQNGLFIRVNSCIRGNSFMPKNNGFSPLTSNKGGLMHLSSFPASIA